MKPSINVAALLTVAGGLGAATLPGTARANCNPTTNIPAPASTGPAVATGDRPQFDPQAEYSAGLAAFQAGDYRRAKTTFAQLIPYAPREASLHYMLGASRIGLGDYKGAVRPLEKAVKLGPHLIIAQQDLAIAYAMTGAMPKAQAMLATLQDKAVSCNGACDDAGQLASAIKAVQASVAS